MEARGSRIRIGHHCRCRAWIRQAAPPPARPVGRGKAIGLRFDVALECGQRAVFDRIVVTHTSRDPESGPVEQRCLQDDSCRGDTPYGTFRRRHTRAWKARWDRADIQIDGPEEDRRAVRFAVFHLIQSCPRQDPSVSIAAKGLTGEGYRGHVFWDAEVFMLPFYVCTNPRAARGLLEYRYRNLDGARRKALAAGFQGAMFPWESADTGDEACPPYVPDPKTGEPVRVLTGELQHHISADVVYAAWRYVRATGDEAYRRKQLLPLAILTARFWASRVWWNRHKGRYEIHDVIGPDEYHEHVRNNAYTNFLAAWNLRLAADEVNRAQAAGSGVRVLRRLDVTDAELGRWREIANGIFLPVLADQGLWEQFEGFLNLRSADPATLSSRKSRLKEKARMRRLARAQVLKQPDVLMLMALFPDKFDRAVRRRNWDYYEPKTTHDSSLSPSVHCLVAADIGLCGKAFEYFRATARIDLDDSMGNTDAGLHFAAIGGTWQAVVKGFLGLRLEGEKPTVNPKLPRQWKSLTMPLRHRDRRYDIQASRAGGVIRVRD